MYGNCKVQIQWLDDAGNVCDRMPFRELDRAWTAWREHTPSISPGSSMRLVDEVDGHVHREHPKCGK